MKPKKKEKVFKRPEVLFEMLALRKQGWTLTELAFRYECRYVSVRKACLRNNLPSKVPLINVPKISFVQSLRDWNGERLSSGKSYKEYMDDERIRKNRLLLQKYSHRIKTT